MTTNPESNPRGPLGILGDRLADDEQQAGLADDLNTLALDLESLAGNLGVVNRALGSLGAALDEGADKSAVSTVYAAAYVMGAFERDVDRLVDDVYDIMRAIRARP